MPEQNTASVLSVNQNDMAIQVNPHGAELTSLVYKGEEYLWGADPAYWGEHAPILFPIVGSVRNDVADSIAGKCAMGRHGIARYLNFDIAAQSNSAVELVASSSEETKKAYPFDFELKIGYTLEQSGTTEGFNSLRHSFSVTNTGDVPLPFSVGGHPAFACPAPKQGDAWEDYKLIFDRPWSYLSPTVKDALWDYDFLVDVLDNSDTLQLDRKLFTYDTIVFKDVPNNSVTFANNSGPLLRLDFEGFPYLGIWSQGFESGSAPFVAIEPWTGTSTRLDEDDVMEHKQDILIAQPGETIQRSYTITFV